MLRGLALSFAIALLAAPAWGSPAADPSPRFLGPTEILLVKADSVFMARAVSWRSPSVPDREKLLLHGLRMRYWRDHLPADMRLVYDALGYPASRMLLTPVGHTEEWWYYGLLEPPLRFRDGILIDTDRFERYLGR